MEASNKTNAQQWLSIVADKFRMSTNGGKEYTALEAIAPTRCQEIEVFSRCSATIL